MKKAVGKMRYLLIIFVILLKHSASTSIAEEINFQVSSMRESAIKDPSVHLYHEMTEDQDETDDTETSPSEIVETLALPESTDLEDMNSKRPRRRRRRRRRKRPKPPVPTEGLDAYHTLPEEEIRRKPSKYRPTENADEVVSESTTFPRRRIPKRRRRPLKRPMEDYPIAGEETPIDYNNTEDVQIDIQAEQGVIEQKENLEPISEELKPKDIEIPKIPIRRLKDDFPKTISDETNNTLRRRKRPAQKTTSEVIEETEQKESPERLQQPPKPTSEPIPIKLKTEDHSKLTDNRKELFKLRRLPPTSAILRHVKIRPLKNETPPTQPSKNATKEEILITNEIQVENITEKLPESPAIPITTITTTSSSSSTSTSTISTSTTEKHPESSTIRFPSTEHKQTIEDSFEFPIITYTGQKHKIDSTVSTTTTEHTAIIYIPCNHTKVPKTLNASNDDITTVNLSSTQTLNQTEKTLQENVTTTAKLEPVNFTKSAENSTSRRISTTQSPTTEILEFSESELLVKAKPSGSKSPIEPEKLTTLSYAREPKRYQDIPKKIDFKEDTQIRKHLPNANPTFVKPFPGSSKEIIISYTSTISPTFPYNEIDPEHLFRENEISLHLRNNTFHRKMFDDNVHRNKSQERKKLPLAVKSAIIISGAILALAVLGFFALLLSCKIRQAKSRMKCHRELYRDQFQNSEFRQSSRSTSPVMSKSNYNGRNFPNNIQPNVASNRNYYLWQTLRKTFQYD